MKAFAKAFYNSEAWATVRALKIEMAHGLCERCGQPGNMVHHKVLLTVANIHDPSVTLDVKKMELLCQTCHNQEHMGSPAIADGLAFDGQGRLVEQGPLPRPIS